MEIQEHSDGTDAGFTLIELLVVIIIIGILAAIAIPVFLNQRQKAVEANMKTDLRNVAARMETTYVDTLTYPTDISVYATDLTYSAGTAVTIVSADGLAYCLQATNPRGTGDIYYDSDGGGIQLPVGTVCT